MAALGEAVELCAKIASLCIQYSLAVNDANTEIERLRREVDGFKHFIQQVAQLPNRPYNLQLSTGQGFHNALNDCLPQLIKTEKTLAPGILSRVGLQVLTWPLETKDVNKVIDNIAAVFSALKFYQCRHLTSGDEIRLIQLDAGDEGSPLRANIQYHHLSENPDYQALSYTWGSSFNQDHPSWNLHQVPTIQRYLFMSDGIIKLTESLYSALLRLRQPAKALIIWADAICIDQSNDEEKAWQIQKMREIYERASRVFIWLGPSDATSDIAMSILQGGYRYLLRTQPYRTSDPISANIPQPKEGQESDDQHIVVSLAKMFGLVRTDTQIPDYPIKAVANLFNRAYWGRGWCWQEFTVGTKIAIVCGEKILEDGDMCIQTFLSTWDMFEQRSRTGQPYSIDHRPWSMMELRRSYHNNAYLKKKGFRDDLTIKNPDGMMPHIWAHQNPELTTMGKACLFREAMGRLSMKELLQESSKSWLETGHKEDQIFALMGIAMDTEELGITVDCNISWEEVYTQLAVAYVKRSDLWFLNYCQCTLPGRSLSLPSWVPDWSQGYRGSLISRHYIALPNHLGTIETGRQPDLREVDPHGTLRLRGIIADEIAWVSSERFPMSKNQLATPLRRRLYRWIREVTLECPLQSRRAIWSVMIADSNGLPLPQKYHDRETDEGMRKILDSVFNSILEQDEVQDEALQELIDCYLRCFMQATDWRCIFETRHGRLGLAHTGIQRGDHVVAFMGVGTAFVIRSVGVFSSVAPRYRMVGESYVHGLMNDQSLKASAVVEEIVLQ